MNTYDLTTGVTNCCEAQTTYVEDVLCCKRCYEEVTEDQR